MYLPINLYHKLPQKPHLSLRFSIFIIYVFIVIFQLFNYFNNQLNHRILGVSDNLSESEILSLINLERVQNHLSPLTFNSKLSQAAQLKAQDMLDNQYFSHKSSTSNPWDFIEATDYSYLHAGENLAKDYYTSDTLVSSWLNSASHRQNILNSNYTETGLAIIYKSPDSETPQTLIVQMFAAPLPPNYLQPNTKVASAGILSSNGDLVSSFSLPINLLLAIGLFLTILIAIESLHLYRLRRKSSPSHKLWQH